MRIAVAGFQHESNSFAPVPTGWTQFRRSGDFPELQRGPAMLRALRGIALPMAGIIPALEAEGAEIVPLAWAVSNPGGPVMAEAFERIAALILSALSDALEAGPLDGLVLELHGAMMAEGFPDAEGELLRRIRAVAGPDLAVTASLDPHANLTPAMVALADALSPYRTYPHVDMHDAGARAARLAVARIRRGRAWARAYRRIDYLTAITSQCTMSGPMAAAMAERARLQALHGCAELAFCFGFPYCDFEGCGPAVAAFAEDQAQADAAADALVAWMAAHEGDFAGAVLPVAEGVAQAIAAPRGPVILADTQDNPGGGGHGDTTGLLAELIGQGAEGAVLGSINDAESAAACHAAGIGATLPLLLGGRSDGAPLALTATVEALTDGRFTCTGPVAGGNPADLGPTALIRVAPAVAPDRGAPGVRVIVASAKMQALDQALFTHIGVDPAAQRILALKSSVHFRAHFEPIASRVLVVAAPGPVAADPSSLPFRHLRSALRR